MPSGSQDRQKNERPGPDREAGRTSAEGEPWGAIGSEVTGIAGAALEQGRHFMDAARAQAIDYVDQRKGEAADTVAQLAASLRESTAALEERPHIQAFVDTAVGGLEQLAETIRERSFGEIYGDVESTIRQRPVAVATATVLAGFLFARFIKSSGEQIYQAEEQRRVRREAARQKATVAPTDAETAAAPAAAI